MAPDELKKLGELLCHWHGGMSDPIYAAGSFFLTSKPHPQPHVVFEARDAVERLLRRQGSLLEKHPRDKQVREDMDELKAILGGLDMYIEWQEIAEEDDDA